MKTYLFLIFIPMILSNIGHMILVKKNAFPSLAKPISPALFGANKTWRGVVTVTALNGLLFCLVNELLPLFDPVTALGIGALLGLTYIVFELPNSWLKRRLRIAPGQKAAKQAWLFMLLDKTDSALGVSLMSKICFQLSWPDTWKLFLLSVLIHVFFSGLLVFMGIKKRF